MLLVRDYVAHMANEVVKRLVEGGHIETKATAAVANRSEEHTSELQSPDHLVCRLLLEKKNQVRPRDELERAITGSSNGCTAGELHTYISSLPHKLDTDPANPTLIETVRSIGYPLHACA